MRSVSSMPPLCACALTAWMRSSTRPSRRSSSSSVEVERDADAVVPGHRPALQPRARRGPRRGRAPRRSRGSGRRRAARPRPARARRAPPRSPGPSRGPSTRRFGMTRSWSRGRRRTRPLDAQLLGDLARVRRGRRPRPRTKSRRSGWRSLIPDCARARRPSCTTRRTVAISREQLRVGLLAPGQPARWTESGTPSHAGRARPQVIGQERHHRRHHAQRLRRAPSTASGTRGLVEP